MRCPHTIATAALLLSSAPAFADYTVVAPVRPLTMSDPSGLTVIGLDFQLTRWTEHPPAPAAAVDVTSVTAEVAADIRLAPHWVLLARVPASHATIDGDPARDGCCSLGLGNLTLGARGLWSSRRGTGVRAVSGFELSVSVPTASDSGDRGSSAAVGAFAELPHDLGRYAPDTTTARLTGITQLYSRWFLLHGELGLQLHLYNGDAPGDRSDLGLRFALGAGIRATHTIAILAELSAQWFFSNRFAGDNDTVTALDVGLRYGSGGAIVGLRVYVPLDSGLRDLDMLGLGLDLGLRF
ncbi:MAG TPA: hypothetical protein VN253_06510 [Kofleriaceae bacterium]|nr:hypothetical protein [Kofleriaceae bacterium]